MSRRTALAVLADLPHPPRSGNHLRDLQNLNVLHELGFETVVVAGDHGWGGVRGVGPHGSLVERVPVTPEVSTARARTRRLARLTAAAFLPGTRPGPWALAYEDAGLPEAVHSAVQDLAPEILMLRSTFAHLAPGLRSRVSRIVLDVHDAESHLAWSLLSLTDPIRLLPALLRVVSARRAERLARLADEAWIPSEKEAKHLRRVAPDTRVLVVPNGIEVPQNLPARRPGRELLLVGGFGYPPNKAAAIRLVEEVLPAVRSRHRDVRVTLVGRDLPAELQERWSRVEVEWLGIVEDLEPVYQRAAALVLGYDESTNAGTPLKVAEAISRGVPVVATPNATQPLGLVDRIHVRNGSNGVALAEAVVELLDDAPSAEALARRAHEWALQALHPQRIAERLRIESLLAAGAALPADQV